MRCDTARARQHSMDDNLNLNLMFYTFRPYGIRTTIPANLITVSSIICWNRKGKRLTYYVVIYKELFLNLQLMLIYITVGKHNTMGWGLSCKKLEQQLMNNKYKYNEPVVQQAGQISLFRKMKTSIVENYRPHCNTTETAVVKTSPLVSQIIDHDQISNDPVNKSYIRRFAVRTHTNRLKYTPHIVQKIQMKYDRKWNSRCEEPVRIENSVQLTKGVSQKLQSENVSRGPDPIQAVVETKTKPGDIDILMSLRNKHNSILLF